MLVPTVSTLMWRAHLMKRLLKKYWRLSKGKRVGKQTLNSRSAKLPPPSPPPFPPPPPPPQSLSSSSSSISFLLFHLSFPSFSLQRENSIYLSTLGPPNAYTPNVCCSPPAGHMAFQSSVCEGTANKLVGSSCFAICCSLLHLLYTLAVSIPAICICVCIL